MPPPLVSASDLTDFPGAPFPLMLVAAASASVRADAGWHIAPVVTETLTLDSDGGRFLVLPTLRLVSVVSVTDVTGTAGWLLDGWRRTQSGALYRANGWPAGYSAVEVTLTHGYTSVPADLLPVIAARCQRSLTDATITQRSETVGARTSSEAYNINRLELEAANTGVERYMLPPRFA